MCVNDFGFYLFIYVAYLQNEILMN